MFAEVQAFGDIAVTPHVLSTQAAMDMLSRGGNAVDAVVAANAVQGVVAPETCGIGGDLFALVWAPDGVRPTALNASGPAGSGARADELRDQGFDEIPPLHPATATIPGCVAGWGELSRAHGRLALDAVLAPAIRLARTGFPASTELSHAFTARMDQLAGIPSGSEMYPAGGAPIRGGRVVRERLGRTLEIVAERGPDGFYRGTVAEAISSAVGERITLDDLASYAPEWVEPLGIEVLGSTGWTVPPNSRGYLTLAALRIFEMVGAPDDPDDPLWTHLLIESYRAAAADSDDLVSDPATAPVPAAELLAERRLAERAGRVDRDRTTRWRPPSPARGGTAYMCAVDAAGMGVSLIQSNYWGIGSNVGAGDAGFILHNRGYGFTLEKGHPDELAPGRRPRHTLSPAMWTRSDRLRAVMGTRGGDQQPQILAQLASRTFLCAERPAVAQRSPRWTVDHRSPEGTVHLERDGEHLVSGLEARGHVVELADRTRGWGPASLIVVEDDLRTGAADPRVDTASAAAR